MVKVGNSECGLTKLTPVSRNCAMAGVVCGVTERARKPSGTNKTRLCGVCAVAAFGAVPSVSTAAAAASRLFDLNDMAVLPIIVVTPC